MRQIKDNDDPRTFERVKTSKVVHVRQWSDLGEARPAKEHPGGGYS